jgi:hypothetical protein
LRLIAANQMPNLMFKGPGPAHCRSQLAITEDALAQGSARRDNRSVA